MWEGQDVVGVKVGLMWRYQQEAGPIIIQLGCLGNPGPAQWIIQVSRAIIIQLQQPVATKPAGPNVGWREDRKRSPKTSHLKVMH